MKNNTFYITTTLPYVNADPHIGFALEIVQADILARYKRQQGGNVFFNTGTDEHGLKIYQKAEAAGKDVQEYVDEYAKRFDNLKEELNLSYDNFIRTTDKNHIEAAQEFWKRCDANGDIEKKEYKSKYCIGCELEKTDSELVNGKCPDHPNQEIEIREEENYFFKFSKYADKLLALYNEQPDFVVPATKMNEIRAFVERGLQDFSISRLKTKMPWGVPVPGDEDHIMYVWFDALVNYISAIGWPGDMEKFEKNWPVVQLAGKDNLRQQSAMWQAMLMSANITPSKQIFIHGHITSGGIKMSKSIGNVVNPSDIVGKYGTEALRYFLAREIHPFEDSDFTEERFIEAYNANLANGLGNLVSRVMKMATSYGVQSFVEPTKDYLMQRSCSQKYLETYEINKAMDEIWLRIGELDATIQEKQPFKLIKTDEAQAKKDVQLLVNEVFRIGYELQPFMPETAEKVMSAVREHKMPKSLFARIDVEK